MEQQTTILSISCKQTHLLAMSLDFFSSFFKLKLDGVFNGAGSQLVVWGTGKKLRVCKLFTINCVYPSMFISLWGFCLYIICILFYVHMIMQCLFMLVLCVILCLDRCNCVCVWYVPKKKRKVFQNTAHMWCTFLCSAKAENRHYSTFTKHPS